MALVLAGLAGGVALVEIVVRRTDVAAGLVLALFFVSETSAIDLGFQVGPLNVFPTDLLFIIMATGATARLLRADRLNTPQRLLIALAVLVGWTVFRGVGSYGLASTVNESHRYLGVVAAALYFSTMEPRQDLLERIGRMWVALAVGLCALTVVRWGATAVGLSGGLFGEGGTMRVLPAAATLVVGQAAMLGVPALREQGTGLRKFLTPVMLVFVVLLQHRTVWVVVAVGMAYLLTREHALTPRVFTALGTGLVLFSVLTFTVLDGGGEAVGDQLAGSVSTTNTFEWRVAGWRALLEDSGPDTVEEAVLGQPPGGGWERRFDGLVVDVSPHNLYVEIYLRLGIAGLICLLALYIIAVRRRRGQVTRQDDAALFLQENVLRTVVGVNLVYFVTYSPDTLQAMLLGLGCAAVLGARFDEEPPFDPPQTARLPEEAR